MDAEMETGKAWTVRSSPSQDDVFRGVMHAPSNFQKLRYLCRQSISVHVDSLLFGGHTVWSCWTGWCFLHAGVFRLHCFSSIGLQLCRFFDCRVNDGTAGGLDHHDSWSPSVVCFSLVAILAFFMHGVIPRWVCSEQVNTDKGKLRVDDPDSTCGSPPSKLDGKSFPALYCHNRVVVEYFGISVEPRKPFCIPTLLCLSSYSSIVLTNKNGSAKRAPM